MSDRPKKTLMAGQECGRLDGITTQPCREPTGIAGLVGHTQRKTGRPIRLFVGTACGHAARYGEQLANMIIFLRRIHQDITLGEILDFLEPAVKGGIFERKGEVVNIKLLEVKNLQGQVVECHAVVHVKPDHVASRVIERLHGHMLRGKRIALHEYVVRSWKNDRRSYPAKPREAKAERRYVPTLRRNLKIEVREIDDGQDDEA